MAKINCYRTVRTRSLLLAVDISFAGCTRPFRTELNRRTFAGLLPVWVDSLAVYGLTRSKIRGPGVTIASYLRKIQARLEGSRF